MVWEEDSQEYFSNDPWEEGVEYVAGLGLQERLYFIEVNAVVLFPISKANMHQSEWWEEDSLFQ